MKIPVAILNAVKHKLQAEMQQFIPASGGCINSGGELVTEQGSYFIKWNDALRFPNMFEAEAKGLELLRSKNNIHIPEVIGFGEVENFQFIVMEFVRASSRKEDYWKQLGKQLATLHKHSAPAFGLDHDNYIGSLKQNNQLHVSWIDFFIEERLLAQLKLAQENRHADKTLVAKFENLFKKLNDLLPEEKPSLLHGDLWSGNLIFNETGEPCLIDPAVYYGHREAEIAFTLLFGGFNNTFYRSYEEEFPLSPGFQKRVDIYNLYPLLVHANLFGSSYIRQVHSILQSFD